MRRAAVPRGYILYVALELDNVQLHANFKLPISIYSFWRQQRARKVGGLGNIYRAYPVISNSLLLNKCFIMQSFTATIYLFVRYVAAEQLFK